VTSSSTTFIGAVTPSFLSSTIAVSPDEALRHARMKMEVGLRRAVAWTIENPIPRFAPVTRMICELSMVVDIVEE